MHSMSEHDKMVHTAMPCIVVYLKLKDIADKTICILYSTALDLQQAIHAFD